VALLLIAGINIWPPRPVDIAVDQFMEEAAMAAWLFDKITKNFLVRCWKMRQAVLGRVKVVRKQVFWIPPNQKCELLKPFVPQSGFGPEWRPWWMEWVPRERRGGNKDVHPRRNFFVVWSVDPVVAHVFYRWCDARDAARGPGFRVRGFDSLAEADKHVADLQV
jgi:hypothetical protein